MKLENIGAIKGLELPGNWYEKADTSAKVGLRWERVFSPNAAPGVEIHLSYRGVPLDEASRKVFSYLRKQGERDLTLEEILALKTLLGVATTGDNQYTNHNPEDSIEGPVFHMNSARLVTIAGKLVLRVEGSFKNNRLYSGIYYPAGIEGKVVEELFIQVVGDELFAKFESTFDEVIASISWK